MQVAMTVTSSDCSGKVGMQVDVKTFQQLGVFGTAVVTAVTAQNALGVEGSYEVASDFVAQQLMAVFRQMPVQAMKTGLLFSPAIIEEVALTLNGKQTQLVIDPVIAAHGGTVVLQEAAIDVLKRKLLPLATVVTPSVPEAARMSGIAIHQEADIERAARQLLSDGVQCVVIKGARIDQQRAIDIAYFTDCALQLESPRIQVPQIEGTGSMFSAAVTAGLAKGYSIKEAIIEAKKFIQLAISDPLFIGHGQRVVNPSAYTQGVTVQELLVKEIDFAL